MNALRKVPIIVLAAVSAAGFFGAACGSSSTSPPSTTAPASHVTPVAWLSSNARQWNSRLNGDQTRVAAAAAATSDVSASSFFARLRSKCLQLRGDVQKAMNAERAPTTALENAWQGMLSATADYASKCLELAHSDTTADVTAWQNSLTDMNNANDNFNKVANAAAKPSSGPSTTSTSTPG
ncbi:MAG: hypothetical protein WB565_14165 [Acidimicrobiales bacterium]